MVIGNPEPRFGARCHRSFGAPCDVLNSSVMLTEGVHRHLDPFFLQDPLPESRKQNE